MWWKWFLAVIISLILVGLPLFLGMKYTRSGIQTDWWSEVRPNITPPNFVFALVWTILYIALLVAGIWIIGVAMENMTAILNITAVVFAVSMFLNLLWSFLFYYRQSARWGLFDILLLDISVITLIVLCAVAGLWVPMVIFCVYLVWLLIATNLNREAVIRERGRKEKAGIDSFRKNSSSSDVGKRTLII